MSLSALGTELEITVAIRITERITLDLRSKFTRCLEIRHNSAVKGDHDLVEKNIPFQSPSADILERLSTLAGLKSLGLGVFEKPHPRRATICFDDPSKCPNPPLLMLITVMSVSRIEGELLHGILLARVEGSETYRRLGVTTTKSNTVKSLEYSMMTVDIT